MNEPQSPNDERFSDLDTPNEMNVAQVHGSIVREREEPSDGYEPIPLWLVTLFMAIVFWAGMYLAFNSGGFEADVFNPKQVAWEGGSGAPAGPPDPMVVGKRLYTANCVACHQTTGQGVAGQFPPLVGSEWVIGGSWVGDNHLVKTLLGGMQGAIQVKGAPYNNAMPAWQQLKDEEIASILTYIRNEWGNSAPPITAEYVASIRATTERSEPWTQADLQKIPAEMISAAAAPAAAPAAGDAAPAADGANPIPPDGATPAATPAPTDPAPTTPAADA